MGCCDSTPSVPDVIIPDPEGEPCVFTIKRCGMFSRDYEVYQGEECEESTRWLFLNKSGSIFSDNATIALENYIREDEENPKQGQILFQCLFDKSPDFQQCLKIKDQNMIDLGVDMFMGMVMGDSRHWGDDDFYLGFCSGGRDYFTTLFIHWNMQTVAQISTDKREGYGFPIALRVYACGTALARYYEVEEPITETNEEGEEVVVGTRHRWEKDVEEFVDTIQFQVENAETGEPCELPSGDPCNWAVDGEFNDDTANWSCPFFTVRQEDGWFSNKPPIVSTNEGVDPALALLIAHLATTEFSPRGIKEDFHPQFPYNPKADIIFGMF